MPRYEGNTREAKTRHHKAMSSGSHGSGHDAKNRKKKQDASRAKSSRQSGNGGSS